jgi:hypothetical protein
MMQTGILDTMSARHDLKAWPGSDDELWTTAEFVARASDGPTLPVRAPARPGQGLALVHSSPDASSRTTFARAVELLQERGFKYIGDDPVGLPCYRSPSGALLIAVGSCRSLAYAMVEGKLQVVAAARTAALVCRITLPGSGIP